MTNGLVRIGVDIGGTFTDIVLEGPPGRHSAKVLTHASAPEVGVLDGLERVLDLAGCAPSEIGVIIHGTTLATNALIERHGAHTALLTTEGFRDTIEMGTESRFDQYDLDMEPPPPLVARPLRFTVAERIAANGEVLRALDEGAVRSLAPRLADAGIESVAIAFLHAFANPAHELRARAILAATLPDLWFSLSSEVSPEIREYERFSTTCANAYVQPLIARYLRRLEARLRERGFGCPLLLILSNGGLAELDTAVRFPVRLVESGPAGGAMLAAHIARRGELARVVSFDMGGTTAKICLLDDATPRSVRTFEVARVYRFKPGSGIPLRIPVVEMVEIGAGGGSIARLDALRRIAVGPESAGADPGPACYAQGGRRATVTDANLVLGRLDPERFAGGRIRLDRAAAERALMADLGTPMSIGTDVAAYGVIEMVDENMANAAREHAAETGASLGGRTLIAFGGSAPLHAARIARKLGIAHILVPAAAGVGSALGFLRAPVAFEIARSAYQRLPSLDNDLVNAHLAAMSAEAHRVVAAAAPGAPRSELRQGHMRYAGQGHEIAVALPAGDIGTDGAAGLIEAYERAYRALYTRLIPNTPIEVMSWSVRVEAAPAPAIETEVGSEAAPAPPDRRRLFDSELGAWREAAVHARDALAPGMTVTGPAVIVEADTASVVPDGFCAVRDRYGDLHISRTENTA